MHQRGWRCRRRQWYVAIIARAPLALMRSARESANILLLFCLGAEVRTRFNSRSASPSDQSAQRWQGLLPRRILLMVATTINADPCGPIPHECGPPDMCSGTTNRTQLQ